MKGAQSKTTPASKAAFALCLAYLLLLVCLNLFGFSELAQLIEAKRIAQIGECYESVQKYLIETLAIALPPVCGLVLIAFHGFKLDTFKSICLLLGVVLTEVSIQTLTC